MSYFAFLALLPIGAGAPSAALSTTPEEPLPGVAGRTFPLFLDILPYFADVKTSALCPMLKPFDATKFPRPRRSGREGELRVWNGLRAVAEDDYAASRSVGIKKGGTP